MSNKNRRNKNSEGEYNRRPRMETVDTATWRIMAKNVSFDESDDDWDEINETMKKRYGKYSRGD